MTSFESIGLPADYTGGAESRDESNFCQNSRPTGTDPVSHWGGSNGTEICPSVSLVSIPWTKPKKGKQKGGTITRVVSGELMLCCDSYAIDSFLSFKTTLMRKTR